MYQIWWSRKTRLISCLKTSRKRYTHKNTFSYFNTHAFPTVVRQSDCLWDCESPFSIACKHKARHQTLTCTYAKSFYTRINDIKTACHWQTNGLLFFLYIYRTELNVHLQNTIFLFDFTRSSSRALFSLPSLCKYYFYARCFRWLMLFNILKPQY